MAASAIFRANNELNSASDVPKRCVKCSLNCSVIVTSLKSPFFSR
jgi:hypothetical protein